jgi:putative pyruvate formate lyase activating enzyme
MNQNSSLETICANNGCNMCPRECTANREDGKLGYCTAPYELKVARAALHLWEEPCISGERGSGTVFFSGCPLKCIYCQNREIALGQVGKIISIDRLVEIFFELKEKGAHNINLVTPSHYVIQIKEALQIAKSKGLDIPIVYNTSGYEKVETLKLLEGLIDIYMPDMKYYSEDIARKYSNASDYFKVAKMAIEEMYRQVGKPVFDENEIMKKGMIVRHLVLPTHSDDSKNIVKYLYETYGDDIYISIMNQYTPCIEMNSEKYPELCETLTISEYDDVVDYAINIGVENAFIQEGETAKESFIPAFDMEGV